VLTLPYGAKRGIYYQKSRPRFEKSPDDRAVAASVPISFRQNKTKSNSKLPDGLFCHALAS